MTASGSVTATGENSLGEVGTSPMIDQDGNVQSLVEAGGISSGAGNSSVTADMIAVENQTDATNDRKCDSLRGMDSWAFLQYGIIFHSSEAGWQRLRQSGCEYSL